MLTDRESRVVGPLVVAFGAGFFAAGLARIIWPAADGMIYLASLGIGFGFPLLAAGLWSIRADMRRLDADVADSTSNRKLTDAKAELMLADAAVRLAATQAPVADESEPDEAPDTAAEWRVSAHRFLVAGDRYGFGVRVLYPMGFVTWDDWGVMLAYLAEAGILVRKPAAGWAADWTLERWYEKGHSTPLPYRKESPPAVALVPTTTTNNSPNSAARVVEGVRAD